jgi:very-short-patch-repair endonuclease
VERAVEQAERLRVLDVRALTDRPAVLRAVLEDYEETGTREELERRLWRVVEKSGLPRPRANAVIDLPGGPLTVDLLWQRERVVVEADSRMHHATTVAFETDRRRDQRLTSAGYRVVRTTWRQVTRRPKELTGTLDVLLDAKRDVWARFASS